MKKLFFISLFILAISTLNLPVSAQVVRGSRANAKFSKNPVQYQSVNAYSDGRGVWLEWKTEVELNNLGFYVYRVGGRTRELVSDFISGASLQARENKITDGSYSFFDRFGDVNSVYLIESVNINNQRHNSQPIQTKPVDDLTTVAGISAEQLTRQSRNANPVITGNESQLPDDLAAEVQENRPAADPVTQRWVAAQPGVKIGVKTEGFYRVSRTDLVANGFDADTPRERWQLYANGVEQAIIVSDDADYIEFYGRGIDTTESDTQTYYLIVGTTNGKRIGEVFRRQVNSGVLAENYSQSFIKKERLSYTNEFLNGDEENFYGTILTNTSGTVNFNLTAVDFSSLNSSIDVKILGLTNLPHQTRVMLNNVEIGVITGSGFASMGKHIDFQTSLLQEGANTLKFLTLAGPSDISGFDSMKVNFARRYRADQNRLSFYVPNYKATAVQNFTSPNIRVFDTTNPDVPAAIAGLSVEPTGNTYRVNFPSNRGRVLFAVENSALSQAVSITRNNPSTLSVAAHNADMIIISHKDFLAQAETWANYRRGQNLSVEVVDIEDVFDEFSYGAYNADAIRNFLQFAKNNWQTAPNYVLLIGDASYDPKKYQISTVNNFIPTRFVDTTYMETGSDDALADFNNDGLAEIAIGRIPASNASSVTLIFNKMVNFEQTVAQGLNRGAVFASDLPDGYDFEGLSGRLRDQLPADIPRIMINRALPNANALLVSEMNTGRFLVNYSGHGTFSVWATSGFFSSTHANLLTNNNNLSIFTMLTCLNGYFVLNSDSLAEVLLKNPNGGAVTAWASSGLTTPDVQEVMATRFYGQIAAGNIRRVGDLVNDAKATINFGRDVRLSWVLLGDPATKVK